MMTSYKTLASLVKKTSSIRPGSSYSCYGVAHGLALALSFGKVDCNAYWDIPGCTVGLYAQYFTAKWGLGGIVNVDYKNRTLDASIEARTSLGPVLLYTETGYAHKEIGTITGLQWRTCDKFTAGLMLKYTAPKADFKPSLLLGAAVGELTLSKLTLTASASYKMAASANATGTATTAEITAPPAYTKQLDLSIESLWKIIPGLDWKVSALWRAKNTGYKKALLKTDVKYSAGRFAASVFAQGVRVGQYGYLVGAEAGYGGVYLKYAYWNGPTWDERLYLYLRSSPGNFTVPALYKQGMLLSGYAKTSIGKHVMMYFTLYGILYSAASGKDGKLFAQIEVCYKL